jgi:hypothetical protein
MKKTKEQYEKDLEKRIKAIRDKIEELSKPAPIGFKYGKAN